MKEPEVKIYSIAEYAALCIPPITRQAVLKQINAGKIKAKKVGRSYVVLEEPPKKPE